MTATDTLSPESLTRLAQFAGWKECDSETYPNYHRVNACLELIEAMRREGFEWQAGCVKNSNEFWTAFDHGNETNMFLSAAPTLPTAIVAAVDKYLDSKEGK